MTGNQRSGDAVIWSMLESSVPEWLSERGTNKRVLGAFRSIAVRASKLDFEFGSGLFPSELSETTHGELGELKFVKRLAYVLSQVEKFSLPNMSAIMQLSTGRVMEEVQSAARMMFSLHRNILSVEPRAQIDFPIADFLRGQGYFVGAGRVPADVMFAAEDYDLVIIDAAEEEEPESVSMIADLIDPQERPVLWLTSAENNKEIEELGVGRSIVKPPLGTALLDAVQTALYIDPISWIEPDVTFRLPDSGLISDEDLAPVSAPVDAEVSNGQLRMVSAAAPEAVVPFSALDALRRQHRIQALELAEDVRASNGSGRIQRKLEALAALLGEALTEDMVIGLAAGVDGCARLLPTIQEEFMPLAAADMASFVYDIQAFTNQFPVCRQFRAEAEASRPILPNEEAALQSVVTVLIDQPDDVVQPALKQRFEILQSARAAQVGSSIGDVAWLRSVSNSLKVVARQVKSFGGEVFSDARGKAVKGLSALILALPVAVGLKLLSVSFPVEFAALTVMLTQSREQITKLTGKADKDEDDD